MNEAERLEEQRIQERRHLAARHKTVLVQCGSFQCLAYVDVDGKWKSYFGNEELKGEVTQVQKP